MVLLSWCVLPGLGTWCGRRNQRTAEQLAHRLQAIGTWLMFKSPFPRTLSGFFRGSPVNPSTITHLTRSHACFCGLFLVPLTLYARATAHSLLLQEMSLLPPADVPTADPSQGPRVCNSVPQSKTPLWFLSAQKLLSPSACPDASRLRGITLAL